DCGHWNGRRNRLPHLAGSIVWRSRWGRRFRLPGDADFHRPSKSRKRLCTPRNPKSDIRNPSSIYSGFVPSTDSPPMLADAADVLSDQLRAHLVRLSTLIKPHAGYLDERFHLRLRSRKYDQKQLKAISAITPGAAA